MDLYILIDRDDLPTVERIMGARLYRCVYKTENVSQYISDLKVFRQGDCRFMKVALRSLF